MKVYSIQDNLGFIIFACLALQIGLLYLVISLATKSHRRAKYEWAQMDLLAKIAHAQGVPVEEIQKTLDAAK